MRLHCFRKLHGLRHLPRRNDAFSVCDVKTNKGAASVVTAHSVREDWIKSKYRFFPVNIILSYSPSFHPLVFTICLCYQSPCSVFVVPLGPFRPTFYHYKSLSRWNILSVSIFMSPSVPVFKKQFCLSFSSRTVPRLDCFWLMFTIGLAEEPYTTYSSEMLWNIYCWAESLIRGIAYENSTRLT